MCIVRISAVVLTGCLVVCLRAGGGLNPVKVRGESGVADTMLPAPGGVDSIPAVFDSAKFLGINSCSLSNCHGGRTDTVGAEFTIWVQDPHAKAFDALRSAAAAQMTRDLGIAEPPHEAARCLACHTVNAPAHQRGEHFALSEGVSCEACHGAARRWVGPHTTPGWKRLSLGQKAEFGLRDIKSLSARTHLCAECHVGSSGRMVDHDLIAVGHPPLMFEMTAYHDKLPKHWNPARDTSRDPAYKARMWLLGQAVAPQLQLESLALDEHGLGVREFALFDCFSCHADLKPNPGQGLAFFPDLRPGAAAWGGWTVSLLQSLNSQSKFVGDRQLVGVSDIRKNLRLGRVNAARARDAVKTGLDDLRAWAAATETMTLSPEHLSSLMIAVSRIDPRQTRLDWYSAWQRYLGLRAVYLSILQSGSAEGVQPTRDLELERQLQELRGLLPFPTNYSSPVDFDVRPLQSVFDAIHKHVSSTAAHFQIPVVRTANGWQPVGSFGDPGRRRHEARYQRFEECFSPLTGVVDELKEGEFDRQYFPGESAMRSQPGS